MKSSFVAPKSDSRPDPEFLVSPRGEYRFASVYIRVSTDDQVELSPESQLEEIEKYARREGIIILRDQVYVDAGISGKKAERRPEFMRMIAAAKEKECPFSLILVWKFSRFARNQEESIFYKSILRTKCGVDVVSITEPLIAGPFGSLIERIIEWMDEFYSIRLSQEVKRSMEVNARRGKLQSTPSFGYRAEGGKLVIREDEAFYVRRIFDSFISGKGLAPIAKELNAAGVRTHRGTAFENRTVEYILRNPVYIGKLRWNPTGRTRRDFNNENIILADGEHEPIISTDIWEAAQRRITEVKAQWGYKARPTYELKSWLSGIVRCSSCGATLIFSAPHYYKCSNYARGRCPQAQHIRKDYLEEAIVSQLRADALSSSSLACKVVYTSQQAGNDLSRMENTLRQLQSKSKRLQDAYLSGVLDLDAFASAKSDLDSAMSALRKDIEDFRSKDEEAQVQRALQDAISAALEAITSPDATLEEKNNAARSVIENCIFNKAEQYLTITYRLFL